MQKGFTLIETVIYVLLIGMILSTLGLFVNHLFTARAKTLSVAQVLSAGRMIQDQLSSAARHAEGINVGSSTFGSDPGVLSFDMVAPGTDPTVFSLTGDDGQLQKTEAGGGAILLTQDDVEITNLIFQNLTGVEDTGIIQVQFTVEAVNASGSVYFDYAQTFQTTLRVPID